MTVNTHSITSRTWDSLKRAYNSDMSHSFRTSPITVISAAVTLLFLVMTLFAHTIAPFDPQDLATIDLMDAFTPPAWSEGGDVRFLIGTDDQGVDLLSSIIHGTKVSVIVGLASVAFAMVLGITLGLVSGYFGGWVDTIIMRIADIQMSIPAILVALLVDGVARGLLPAEQHNDMALYVIVFSIGVSSWVQFARTVRGSTLSLKNREYVMAAKIVGRHPLFIMFRHVLPNTMGPVLVIATISLAMAIIVEATLSFLGIGLPPTQPSLGTLLRIGNEFLFSGEWWICLFPGLTLVILAMSVNLLGDWLRDALNPKLR